MARLTITGPHSGWQSAYLAGEDIGGLGQTTHETPSMRWYWRAGIFFGHCETRDEAVAEIEAAVPTILAVKAKEAAKRAEFDAMPAHLQELKSAMDAAEFERQRIWGRQPFDDAEYRLASELASSAYTAFHVAHDAWASRSKRDSRPRAA